MAKNSHNGTNLIAKHYTIFLGEEILGFFKVPTVKTHLGGPGAEDSSPLTWSESCG